MNYHTSILLVWLLECYSWVSSTVKISFCFLFYLMRKMFSLYNVWINEKFTETLVVAIILLSNRYYVIFIKLIVERVMNMDYNSKRRLSPSSDIDVSKHIKLEDGCSGKKIHRFLIYYIVWIISWLAHSKFDSFTF